MAQITPYGSWKSPIISDLIVSSTIGLGQTILNGDTIYWLEARPTEGGRTVLVQRSMDGQIRDVTPAPFNVRTRVHEYGGGAYWVQNGTVYFVNFADQHLYQQSAATPTPITTNSGYRYADGTVIGRKHLICVREDHTGNGEAINTLVRLDLQNLPQAPTVLAEGNDFYASPCLSPNHAHLAWLTWNHPHMPWDGTELWVGDLQADGRLTNTQRVAGGTEESIFQPAWSPDGVLHFVSDRTGWWNLYRWHVGQVEPLLSMEVEFGEPQWVFGQSTYGFVSANQIICTYHDRGIQSLASLDCTTGKLAKIETPTRRSIACKLTQSAQSLLVALLPKQQPSSS